MEKTLKSVKTWVNDHLAGLFVFNLIVLILVLLNTADYFKPFFFLGINFIFFFALILAAILLGAREKVMFSLALIFLVLTAFFKLLKVNIWADRASIYFFQSFIIGLVIFIWKNEKA